MRTAWDRKAGTLYPGNFSLSLDPQCPCPELLSSFIWETFRDHQGYLYKEDSVLGTEEVSKELMTNPFVLVLTLAFPSVSSLVILCGL